MKDKPAEHESTQTEPVLHGPRALDGEIWRDWQARGDADPDFLAKLVALFVKDSTERLAAMANALKKGNAIECARAAHALATGCLHIGATRMAKQCMDIERAAQDGTTEACPQLIQRVRDEFLLVKRELEDAIAHTGT